MVRSAVSGLPVKVLSYQMFNVQNALLGCSYCDICMAPLACADTVLQPSVSC